MGFEPTISQDNILKSNKKNIAVMASAGSGKTTLMIEKIVKTLIEDNADISKFLICTFTNSAGEEMKSRLYDKLASEIAGEKDIQKRKYLQKNYENIENAKICTIDKMSLDIVKKYFYKIKIDPNLQIISEFEANFLKNRAFNLCIEELSRTNKELIDDLCFYFLQDRDLAKFKSLVLSLYGSIQKMSSVNEFLEKSINLYNKENVLDIIDNKLNEFEIELSGFIAYYKSLLQVLNEDEKLYLALLNDINLMESYFNFDKDNKIKFIFNLTLNSHLPSSKNLEKTTITPRRSEFTTYVKEICKFFGARDIDVILLRADESRNILIKLLNFLKYFCDKFSDLKKIQNQYEFDDIQHLALKLLNENDVLNDYCKDIEYVFVDEYQDVNYVLEELVDTLSNNSKLFIVGDPKQSIYGFRSSTPAILLKKFEKFSSVDDGMVEKLNENFRSDTTILEFVNQIFNKIMTSELSGVDYEGTSKLKGKNVFDNGDLLDKVQIDILLNDESNNETKSANDGFSVYDLSKESSKSIDYSKKEAEHIVNLVCEVLECKIFDNKENKLRKVTFKDIAILFRSRSKVYDEVIEKLSALGAPISATYKKDVFDSIEVKFVNAVLSLAVNFKDDIQLATALTFPCIGLSEDELVLIRVNSPSAEYFADAVLNFMSGINSSEDALKIFEDYIDINKLSEKIKKLLNFIDIVKNNMYFCSVYELIIMLNDYFELDVVLSALKNAEILANYKKFLEEIKNGKNYNLIDYLHYLQVREKDKTKVMLNGGDDSITCCSIHESKGLEYPVVILAYAGRNEPYTADEMVITDNGIGVNFYNVDERWKAPTIVKNYIVEQAKYESIEESKRLLYVALTRAKNKLFVVGTMPKSSLDKKLKKGQTASYLNFILSYLTESEIEALKQGKNLKNQYANFRLIDEILPYGNTQDKSNICELKDDMKNKILEYLDLEYKFKDNVQIAFKNTVSGILRAENVGENYCTEPQKLTISEHNITANELGTLYHKVLENVDFKRDYDLESITKLINSLKIDEQIVDKELILNAVETIGALVSNEDEILKEQPFIFKAPYNNVVDSNCDEIVLVQGVIDLIIKKPNNKVIIVDYKNTNIKSKTMLKDKYFKQLSLYSYATKQVMTNAEIETYLYSIKFGDLIKV